MSEYIERNKVIQLLLDACSECKDGCMEFDGFLPDCTQCVIGEYKVEISRLPVADVQPVKHGKWGKYSNTCSNCGISKYNFISFNFDDKNGYARPFGTWNYCPRCGALMDGET